MDTATDCGLAGGDAADGETLADSCHRGASKHHEYLTRVRLYDKICYDGISLSPVLLRRYGAGASTVPCFARSRHPGGSPLRARQLAMPPRPQGVARGGGFTFRAVPNGAALCAPV